MLKRLAILLMGVFLFVSVLPEKSEANTHVHEAIFDSFVFTNEGESNRTLSYVVLENSQGKTNRYRIDDSAYLFINNTATTVDGFKYGMTVDVTRNNLGKVIRLEGYSNTGDGEGTIVENSRNLNGLVATIDPYGDYIAVKLDSGKTEDFYVTSDTEFFKGMQNVDFSFMYEGDRVKLSFSEANANTLSEVEIIQDGIMIENLYRGTLNNVNAISNRLTVKGAVSFTNWEFGATNSQAFKTYKFNNSTSIYYGNKLIRKSQMRNYRNSPVYFVTTKINNEEIVKKVIIMQNFERTFYDQINVINPSLKAFTLASSGSYFYHNGSILIRNGRLVEPSSLATKGSAFVLTDGKSSSKYTHVVNVTNDSFLSPNLASHELYFGKLSDFNDNRYTIQTADMHLLKNNVWSKTTKSPLAYSNNTKFTYRNGNVTLVAQGLYNLKNKYGYFYVKDGHIISAHFVNSSETVKDRIYTGRLSKVDAVGSSIELTDTTQWRNGVWSQLPNLQALKVGQALIIKNGEVITASQLKRNDRIVVISDANFQSDILLVNE